MRRNFFTERFGKQKKRTITDKQGKTEIVDELEFNIESLPTIVFGIVFILSLLSYLIIRDGVVEDILKTSLGALIGSVSRGAFKPRGAESEGLQNY